VKLIPKALLGLGLMALPAFCGAISENTWYTFGWIGTGAPTDAGGGSAFPAYSTGGTSVSNLPCSPSAAFCDSFTQPWVFTGSGTIFVQDLYYDGDQFQVWDNGSLLGTTSTPSNDGTLCGASPYNNPNATGCAGNTKFSTGSFTLSSSGVNDISIKVIAETNGITSGQAVFEITAPVQPPPPTVPEPTTLSMMGLGLGLFFGLRARRKA
jgi:hypothetical protein